MVKLFRGNPFRCVEYLGCKSKSWVYLFLSISGDCLVLTISIISITPLLSLYKTL